MSSFWAIIKFLASLWEAYKEILRVAAERRAAERAEKLQRLEQSLEDAKNAKTPEDAFKAQEGVVNNSN